MEEKKITMQDLWLLLQPSKVFDTRGRFEKCLADWNSMDETQQRRVFKLLQAKKEQTGLNPNPYYALNDAMQEDEQQQARVPKEGPTDYNGRQLPNVPVFSAKYNGKWGMYTQEDINKYHLEKAKN